ncbi:MAG: hypothetical protein QOE70_5734 [Chthoniobacter sp.]|jgi:hypothetical protein|nr:hypothetical protein [Chthoniobacter sp.]
MSLPPALRPLLAIAFALLAGTAMAQNPPERTRLYTAPDPASPGGLKGHIAKPELPIEQILALPTASPEEVYLGEITGPKRDAFSFKNLPVGKYDLIVIYPAAFYEGLQLNRDASTLSPDDLKKIDASIQKSEPFFTKKILHRVEGETGRGSGARGICTYFREKGSELLLEQFEGKSSRPDFRRTFKLVLLKDVGPGWQIARARDLYPVWVDPKRSLPEHHFSAALNQLRVADQIKDLGDLDITH